MTDRRHFPAILCLLLLAVSSPAAAMDSVEPSPFREWTKWISATWSSVVAIGETALDALLDDEPKPGEPNQDEGQDQRGAAPTVQHPVEPDDQDERGGEIDPIG